MTLHTQKRIAQNHGRCDNADCRRSPEEKVQVTLATGERGGAGDYTALYACSWGCAIVVAYEAYKAAAYTELESL